MNYLGVDSMKRRALRLAGRPKCGMQWGRENVTEYLEPGHQHKCVKVSRHASIHVCNCGSQRMKKP